METIIALVVVIAVVAAALAFWPKQSDENNTPKNGGNYGGSVDREPTQTENLK